MLEKAKQELLDITSEISALEIEKSLLESQAEMQRQELLKINDESARLQSALIQKNRVKTELEIVEKWLSEKETSGGVI